MHSAQSWGKFKMSKCGYFLGVQCFQLYAVKMALNSAIIKQIKILSHIHEFLPVLNLQYNCECEMSAVETRIVCSFFQL